MPKRKCLYLPEYTKEWRFIKKGRYNDEILCSMCNSYINIGHGGRSDIRDHLKSKKHIQKISNASSSQNIGNYFISSSSPENNKIAIAELTIAYHTVKHHQSFRSADCGNKLYPALFADSKIATKFSSARTKSAALINGILGPYALETVITEARTKTFYSISTDASNHKAIKMFPVILQYFSEKEGILQKLVRLDHLNDEKAETIANYCIETVRKLNLESSCCTAFCGDNANTNFGGLQRRGVNNIFFKLKRNFAASIEGIGCPAHILHNCVQTAADTLKIDVECIVLKIYNYFSIYTVRTERLKDFCAFTEIEFQTLLSHSKTRWLSMFPAVEKILKLFDALKSFFLSEENPPKILADFFKNPLSEAYLFLVHSQLFLFHKHILKIESSNVTIMEVIKNMESVSNTLEEKINSNFIPMKIKEIMKNDDITTEAKANFKKEILNFYSVAKNYLGKWTEPLLHLKVFNWMLLDSMPSFESVQNSVSFLSSKNICVNEDALFIEFVGLKKILEKKLLNNEFRAKLCCHKWTEIFSEYEFREQYVEMLKLSEYVFSLPPNNATVERIFSLMNIQWTEERNQLSIKTLENILFCIQNFAMSCSEFSEHIKDKDTLLKRVSKNEKY